MNEEIEYGIVAHLYNELSGPADNYIAKWWSLESASWTRNFDPAEQDDSLKNLIMPVNWSILITV